MIDYGCGRGDDLRYLAAIGIKASGWDPVHAPKRLSNSADIVNLAYVLNVIEDPTERAEALRDAWSYCREVLIVSVRLNAESTGLAGERYGDGILTRQNTFQRFYSQGEIRHYVESLLEVNTLAAGPGVIYAFRQISHLEFVRSARYFRRSLLPQSLAAKDMLEKHSNLLSPLLDFAQGCGRLPTPAEIEMPGPLVEAFGSVRKALAVINIAVGREAWSTARKRRKDDIRVYLAGALLEHRPALNALELRAQIDIKTLFGSYRKACDEAEKLLWAAGDSDLRESAMREAPFGKLTQKALYVHVKALEELPALLRTYEACSRAFLGMVSGATLIKLYRDESRISYLYYPDFERDPHPALAASLTVDLASLDFKTIDYSARENPPILHRKEEFLVPDDPLRNRFSRLTRQEEKLGLYEQSRKIGTRREWDAVLSERNVRCRGHRIVRLDPR